MNETESYDRVDCPSCGQLSDSIKCYSTMILVFLWAFAWWQPKNEVGCPSCIRGKIGLFALINVLTANILWPFIILPWALVLFAMSFTSGHSSTVRQILDQARDEERHRNLDRFDDEQDVDDHRGRRDDDDRIQDRRGRFS